MCTEINAKNGIIRSRDAGTKKSERPGIKSHQIRRHLNQSPWQQGLVLQSDPHHKDYINIYF